MDEKDWAEFKKKLKAKTEIDLDLYKEPQMKRRIGNLVTRSTVKTYTEYFDMVSKNKDDFAEFIEYLTINVSEFFRTPEKFSKLETLIEAIGLRKEDVCTHCFDGSSFHTLEEDNMD